MILSILQLYVFAETCLRSTMTSRFTLSVALPLQVYQQLTTVHVVSSRAEVVALSIRRTVLIVLYCVHTFIFMGLICECLLVERLSSLRSFRLSALSYRSPTTPSPAPSPSTQTCLAQDMTGAGLFFGLMGGPLIYPWTLMGSAEQPEWGVRSEEWAVREDGHQADACLNINWYWTNNWTHTFSAKTKRSRDQIKRKDYPKGTPLRHCET